MDIAAPVRRRPTYADELRGWALHVLDRIGHVCFENPVTLLAFAGRLLSAAPAGLAELGSRRGLVVLGRLARQFFRTLLRSLVLVAALGVAAAMGIGAVARLGGSFFQPLLEQVVLVVVLRDLAPLALAVALAARMGVSITTRLAVLPARRSRETVTFGPREMNRIVLPPLLAGAATAPVLFVVLGWFIANGYQSYGSIRALLQAPLRFPVPDLWPALAAGAWRAAAFGWIVAYVAAALGVRSAERFSSEAGEELELNDAVWEASVISLLLCAGITAFFLTRAGVP
jgi:ABC-type transporter Mla maintaining outer membrane lipid asymmetry permease subunit MlaE